MVPDYWGEAKAHLAKRDKVLRKLVRKLPDAELGTRGDAFQTLARSIVGQQVSIRAAQSVWSRFTSAVEAAADDPLEPAAVLARRIDDLRGAGLSARKVDYLVDLARHFHDGTVHVTQWREMDDEAIIEELIAVKGIGRWSVEMFLIFHMMRPNVLPVGDLGLRRAMERAYNEGEALTKDDMRRIAAPWAPFSSVGTWYMWRSLDEVNF